MKPKLSNVSSKYGCPMGRIGAYPIDANAPLKLHLTRLKLIDGDYDQGGAYWGNTPGTSIYWALSDEEVATRFARGSSTDRIEQVSIFVRATSREDAKTKVRQHVHNARFYR